MNNNATGYNPFYAKYQEKKALGKKALELTHIVFASLRRRRGNPVFPVAACLDCFAALAMTRVMRKS
jgi:hypothetical protein